MTAGPQLKKKVVFILGATGAGKTRLSIDIATHFPAEIINSDKIQIYKGLDITTNKITDREMKGIPHHLLSVLDQPEADFTSTDFCLHALIAIESILESNRLPVVFGGSNSFIEALIERNSIINFNQKYQACFMWIDVATPVLFARVSNRVNEMIELGFLDELRQLDYNKIDSSKGIYRSIGVQELKDFILAEKLGSELKADEVELEKLMKEGMEEMKLKTCELAMKQVRRIEAVAKAHGWEMHRIDATEVLEMASREEAEKVWEAMVSREAVRIVERFLKEAATVAEEEEAPAAILKVA